MNLAALPAAGYDLSSYRIVGEYCWWRAPPHQSQIGCVMRVGLDDNLGLCDHHRQELITLEGASGQTEDHHR